MKITQNLSMIIGAIDYMITLILSSLYITFQDHNKFKSKG